MSRLYELHSRDLSIVLLFKSFSSTRALSSCSLIWNSFFSSLTMWVFDIVWHTLRLRIFWLKFRYQSWELLWRNFREFKFECRNQVDVSTSIRTRTQLSWKETTRRWRWFAFLIDWFVCAFSSKVSECDLTQKRSVFWRCQFVVLNVIDFRILRWIFEIVSIDKINLCSLNAYFR